MKIAMIKNFILFFILTIYSFGQSQNGLNSITKEELFQTVTYLSSEELEGRLAGTEGYNLAADFSSDKFFDLKLKPFNGMSYYQDFLIECNEIQNPYKFNLIKNDEIVNKYQLGKDFAFRGFTGSGDFTADVVYCGYGISQPKIGYDDYSNIDVNGKIVMVFKFNPSWKIEDNQWTPATPRFKSKVAFEHGAKGILFVSFPNDENPQKPIGSVMCGEGEQLEDFPQLHIDIPVADEFLNGSGYNLKGLQTKIDSSKQPFSVTLNSQAEIFVKANYRKEAPTKNVIGILEGKDPILKDEYIIIGAHLDHVGQQANEIYFPGANDNASGSAAVLEIAEAFVEGRINNKRSIIFILFAGEESGLKGSQYYADNPIVPLEKTVAMLNMDCIGVGDSIMIGSGQSCPNLWNLIKEIDKKYYNMSVSNTWKGGGADAQPFFDKGVPTAYFVTTNSYPHLHLTTDKPETLNLDLYEKMVKLVFLTAEKIANGEYEREDIIVN
ncbi:MAG: M20/M25/M40 family metallo-hydrolase [Ignavibacteriales bacterium]|nr:M20/M25/M40 family metallo-hydrolase [Ignavibacteriales bacterium]